ncbi:hypothetical protein CEW88_14445 [Alloyangia pacifica]|uniref:DUF2946 domain-containing protein n=1 Tax=Alloyangia pacifica TaxID=311180 RepID=A0A2U8HGS4_9RHOB|nr:hypothetical protein [Alloyangia pacifica]AWI84972.1 hypothetical protein CEW88_14445 [Alloyangia pacifica]
MIRAHAHRLTLAVAVLAVALASVLFAARMAPEGPEAASLRSYLAMGGTLADLCETEGTHHGHHCPVCNLLPEAPRTVPPALALRIDRSFEVVILRGLGLPPQPANPRRSPRAPPALA